VKLIRKKITIHGGNELFILKPCDISKSVTAGHDNKGFVLIWGNGSGYQFLAECFSIAASLQKNEILYIPIRYCPSDDFKETFNGFEYNYNIVCVNYCETQISLKDIEEILKIKIYTEETIILMPDVNTEYIDRWKTNRRLTVKIHRTNMYISTNRDGFHSLSRGACNLTEYGDEFINDYLPHMHYDWHENTSTSVGITLYYWHDK
jgi:regulator of sigma D